MELDTIYHDRFVSIDDKSEKSIASAILDIEALYNHNFKNGWLFLDEIILKKCKRKLISAFHANGYYNLSIECDIMDLKESNALNGIDIVPRVYVKFVPQELKSRDYLVDGIEPIIETEDQKQFNENKWKTINKENSDIQNAINSLNNLIHSSERHDIINVRMNNLSDHDGYNIYLDLENLQNIGELITRVLLFKNDVSALNMDELIISQQFTSEFFVQHKNPFWLNTVLNSPAKLSDNESLDEMFSKSCLIISLYNSNYQIPTYSLQIIIDLIIATIYENIHHDFVDLSENDEDVIKINHLLFKKSYKLKKDITINCDSISGSYFFINIKAMP